MNSNLQNIYQKIAGVYERVNHVMTFGLDRSWRKSAAKIAVADTGNVWLDVCSGTGEMAEALLRARSRLTSGDLKNIELYLHDGSDEMLREVAKRPTLSAAKMVMSDVTTLPFLDGKFDLLTMSFATRNVSLVDGGLERVFREFYRVLKPGGKFVNLETSQPRSKLIRILMHSYVRLPVRLIGRSVGGSDAGYAYLASSILSFHGAEELAAIIQKAGFTDVSFKRKMFGVVAIHVANRSSS